MSKKDYKSDGKGRKQFSIDHIKFHDSEAAEELFGYGGRYQTPPQTAVGGMGMVDIPQRSSEDPVAEFIGPYEPDTQRFDEAHYKRDLSDMNRTDAPGKKAESAVRAYRSAGEETDPSGSYTGHPRETREHANADPKELPEVPVQDQDDL